MIEKDSVAENDSFNFNGILLNKSHSYRNLVVIFSFNLQIIIILNKRNKQLEQIISFQKDLLRFLFNHP